MTGPKATTPEQRGFRPLLETARMEPSINPYASPGSRELNETARAALAQASTGRHARFSSARPRAKRVVFFFSAAMLLLLAELAYHCVLVAFLLRAESGLGVSSGEATGLAIADLALSLLHGVVRLALFALFLLWFQRAYRNLPSLGAAELSSSSMEAVLCFFIPFLNLVRPYQLAQEIWRGSDLSELDPEQKVVFSSALVGWWWVFVWISILLRLAAWYTNRYTGSAGNTLVAGEALVAVWFSMGAVLMQMIAALLGLHVVKTITTNQDEKWRRLATQDTALTAEA